MKLTASAMLVMGLFVAGVAHAQVVPKQMPDSFWDDRIIKVEYTGWGMQLQAGTTQSTIPFIQPEIRTLLDKFPDSKAALEGFDNKYVSGQVMLWSGFAVAIGGLITVGSQSDSSNPQPVVIGTGSVLAIGGLLVELWGGGTILGSYRDLFQGVNLYNKEAFETYSAE